MTNSSTIANDTELILEGIPASAGIAISNACVVAPVTGDLPDIEELEESEIALEVKRFHTAIDDAEKILHQIEAMAREEVKDQAGIFEAHRMMLRDPELVDAIVARIETKRATAHAAISAEMDRLASHFTALADVTMHARAEDIRALESHLIGCLANRGIPRGFHNTPVVVLHALSPGDTVIYCRNKAAGFVLESGGINSHSAILARAFNVPMVAGIRELFGRVHTEDLVIIDGYNGRVVIRPTEETVAHYRKRLKEIEDRRRGMAQLRFLPARTTDDERITLASNLDMIDEMEAVIENGAEEIGLLRTEYLVMGRDGDISMEEQLVYYRQIAERAYPRTVTLRAFDIGSDKLAGEIWGYNHNPLDLRGTRLLLARDEIFRRQIEAILRASILKNLKLMLPMVISVEEMRRARIFIDEVRNDLRTRGVRFDEGMQIGAMIETPAAALTASAIAAESDFLSLGTNDLTQYTLAVDREDESVAKLYDEFHPAVLQLIFASIVAGMRAKLPVTLCGEMAAHPLATALLIGMGLRCFSVAPHELGPLKMRVRATNAMEAQAVAIRALQLTTATEVREYLASMMPAEVGGEEGVDGPKSYHDP